MALPQAFELVDQFGKADPTLLGDVVDTESLSSWASIRPLAEDFKFVLGTLGVAYDAAVFSAMRNRAAGQLLDLPIGAAVGDSFSGLFFAAYAQDKETGDPEAHAEVSAIRHAQELGVSVVGTTLGVTVEPCPKCLHTIEDAGISRVVFGSSRAEVEELGLIKPHGIKAAEIVKAGRIASRSRFPMEFFQFPNRAVQSACLEVLAAFKRNIDTEVVEVNSSYMNATRFSDYARFTEETQLVPINEGDLILRGFRDVLEGYYHNALELRF